jgi:hypothetical protein
LKAPFLDIFFAKKLTPARGSRRRRQKIDDFSKKIAFFCDFRAKKFRIFQNFRRSARLLKKSFNARNRQSKGHRSICESKLQVARL